MSATDRPLPRPDRFTRPFWEACARGELMAAECAACGHLFLPPGPLCPVCWAAEPGLRPLCGEGRVWSFAVYRRTYHPAFPAPYVVALVELREGPRLISNIVGCDPGDVVVDLPVRVRFEHVDGFSLPRFERAPESSESSAGGSARAEGTAPAHGGAPDPVGS